MGAIVKDTIKVSVQVGKGILVHAKGNPAKTVGVAAAAGVAVISFAVAYGTYRSAKFLWNKATSPSIDSNDETALK